MKNISTKLTDIRHLKISDTWKVQLTITIKFVSFKDNDEEHIMHAKNDNVEIMINEKADKVPEVLFQPLLSRYQIRLETSSSDFIFDCIHLYYKCQKINFR